MTHTLHPEIEKILDAITLDYFLQSWEAWKKIDYKQRMKDKIVKHLWPYIRMPTDQKDSEKSIPKIEKMEYCEDVEQLVEYEKSIDKVGIYMALYELRKWSRKMTKSHNALIDYITNTLPTMKS